MEEYKRIARFYDLVIEPLVHHIRRDFAELVQSWRPSRILDLGCGTGKQLSLLPEGIESFGLDQSPAMLSRARRQTPGSLVLGNVAATPFQTGTFDLAFCQFALHEKSPETIAGLLDEVQRLVLPGGRFVIVDFARPQQASFRGRVTARGIRFIEKHAGKEHFQNFQHWMAAGGADQIQRQRGWAVVLSKSYTYGNIRLVVFRI